MSDKGFWNRAGRRSGGNRPFAIAIAPEVNCACGTKTAFGLLPQRVTGEVVVKTCPGCEGVLFFNTGSHWLSAAGAYVEEHVDKGVDAR